MQILFKNGVQVPIRLTNSSVQDTLLSIYKHLQHVQIPYRVWDNSLYCDTLDYQQLIDQLVSCGQELGVDVDKNIHSQQYFNYLHEVYERRYDGRNEWLAFHEHIHLCEGYYIHNPHNTLTLDYREKSGLLERPFDLSWMQSATTKLKAGDVYLRWAELGKTPYDYYQDKEPENINRLCELAKPWLILRPRLMITFTDTDRMNNLDVNGFNTWWSKYDQDWCKYYKIPHWTVEEQHSVIVIGHIDSIETVIDLLDSQIYPIKVQL